MNKSFKIIMIFISIISILSSIIFFSMKEEQKKMQVAIQKRYDVLQKENIDLKFALQEATTAKSKFEAQLEELNNQTNQLRQQLESEKGLKEQLKAKSEELLKVIQQLQKNFEEQKTSKADLENQFAKIKSDYEALKSRYEGAWGKPASGQYDEQSRKRIELQKIVLKPAGGIEGKILSINKEHNFVVIDLGKEQGISKGMIFDVYRGKRQIGKVQIETVRQAMSAAVVLKDWTTASIVAGDIVKLI